MNTRWQGGGCLSVRARRRSRSAIRARSSPPERRRRRDRGVILLALAFTSLHRAPMPSLAAEAGKHVEVAAESYRSEAGRFEVRMPGPPEVQSSSYRTVAGRIRSTEYAVEIGSREFLVEHYDLPRLTSLILPDKMILRRAKGDFLESVGGQERACRETTVQGHPARSVSFDVAGPPERVGEAILVLVARRLYLVFVTHPRDDAAGPQLAQMLRTFRVW